MKYFTEFSEAIFFEGVPPQGGGVLAQFVAQLAAFCQPERPSRLGPPGTMEPRDLSVPLMIVLSSEGFHVPTCVAMYDMIEYFKNFRPIHCIVTGAIGHGLIIPIQAASERIITRNATIHLGEFQVQNIGNGYLSALHATLDNFQADNDAILKFCHNIVPKEKVPDFMNRYAAKGRLDAEAAVDFGLVDAILEYSEEETGQGWQQRLSQLDRAKERAADPTGKGQYI